MWRLLELLKWQGFHTSPKDARPGELILFCLACLQPGVNISKKDIELSQHVPTGNFRWKFTRTLVMDGNFKAKHMHSKDPSNEVWLMDGKGFIVESMPYKEYLKGITNVVESRDWTAATIMLSIMQMPTEINWHRLASVVVPVQGMGALYHMQCKNLGCQLRANQFVSMLASLTIQPGIGLWHIHGHQTECFVWYASNFIPGVGHVDGEIMERLWSSLNIISPLAQGMATPHQQELLDFQMIDNNFLKMI
ncbi:hypothetical protein V8B97DRAFT_1920554 [Scleroderma yunnanense]